MLTMFFGCCGTRFAQTSSHLIQKISTILLIFIRRTNEQPYDFMKKWACFSIFEVNLEITKRGAVVCCTFDIEEHFYI